VTIEDFPKQKDKFIAKLTEKLEKTPRYSVNATFAHVTEHQIEQLKELRGNLVTEDAHGTPHPASVSIALSDPKEVIFWLKALPLPPTTVSITDSICPRDRRPTERWKVVDEKAMLAFMAEVSLEDAAKNDFRLWLRDQELANAKK